MSSARAGLSPCIVPIREAASGRRIGAVIREKKELRREVEAARFFLVIDLVENRIRGLPSSRPSERLEWKIVPWSELKPHIDVFEADGKGRIGLFVANNPINKVDPTGQAIPLLLFSGFGLVTLGAVVTTLYNPPPLPAPTAQQSTCAQLKAQYEALKNYNSNMANQGAPLGSNISGESSQMQQNITIQSNVTQMQNIKNKANAIPGCCTDDW